jgi:filamentous hemagglutinin family protein
MSLSLRVNPPSRRPDATALRGWCAVVFSVLVLVCVPGSPSFGGDILRGGANRSTDATRAASMATSSQAQALKLQAIAQERLNRTTDSLRVMQAAQAAARAAAGGSSIVPNGLVPGGLEVLTGANAKWQGAQAPVAQGNLVNIKQTQSQAVLNWKTFNVGTRTTVNFDQSSGGAEASSWIAFNNVLDPSGAPSQIRGNITAEGQVYIINQNGIVFGGSSQVNTRALVASALPINENLVRQGLLNNRDAQFIFSAVRVPGGSDGTPPFEPPAAPNGRSGDVVVEPGALLQTSVSPEGGGGRVMLVGANVRNEGNISTPSGQTIFAAGNQVAMMAHSGDDPSLRGLDVWVGQVDDYAGSVINRGVIQSLTGSITMVGKRIQQDGNLLSSTSVSLNGRIDLLASYGAVANPNFDNPGQSGYQAPAFLNQFTGNVSLGAGSVTTIMPQIDGQTVPGTALPERSQINIDGVSVYLGPDAMVRAPGGEVNMRAGSWPYRDLDGNGTILNPDGGVDPEFFNFLAGGQQLFLHDRGQVYFDEGSLVDVSGSTTALVSLGQYVVEVAMRGNELADSPLQRDSLIRGLDMTVDLRRSGNNGGRFWVGTPLGDLTGLLNIIESDVLQLTSAGGDISVRAGESIVVRRGAVLDVSGGVLEYEGGKVQTTRFVSGSRLIDVADATPDIVYDSVYTGQSSRTSKWTLPKVYAHPLAPLGGYQEDAHLEGDSGGTLSLTAASMVLDGELLGRTFKSARQLENQPAAAELSLSFLSQKRLDRAAGPVFLDHSPIAPSVTLLSGQLGMPPVTAPEFSLAGEEATPIPASVTGSLVITAGLLDEDDGGFGALRIDNREADVTVAGTSPLRMQAGGALEVRAANVSVLTPIIAPGGRVALTANNYSPFLLDELKALQLFDNAPAPSAVPGRGVVFLAPAASINTAGMLVDLRPRTATGPAVPYQIDGGSITLEGYSVQLPVGSTLDASAGGKVGPRGSMDFGHAGDIAILAGQDPALATSIGGELVLDGRLMAAGVEDGGSLTVKANQIQIGGSAAPPGGLLLSPDFFRRGGFADYHIIGIGGRDGAGEAIPGLQVAGGTSIAPSVRTLGPTLAPDFRLVARAQPVGLRPPASLELEAIGVDDSFTEDVIEAIGLVTLGRGSSIVTEPLGKVTVSGDVVLALGSITAPGGAISLKGGSSFPLLEELQGRAAFPLPTVYLGPQARLSAAGAVISLPDAYGRRAGVVVDGGSVELEGNILAEAGSAIDVSGASAVLDYHPSRLGRATPYGIAGLTTTPYGRQSARVRVSSDGGTIRLAGSQMLYSDAKLMAEAGGRDSIGGTLSVSSGRYGGAGAPPTSADINLVVQQSGSAAAFGDTAIYGDFADAARFLGPGSDLAELYGAGSSNPGLGFFAVSQFSQGGFNSLDLGFEFFDSADPAFGGNLEFRGDVSIEAAGFVRLAGGGVIKADGAVNVTAAYVAIGQEFRAPGDPLQRQPFTQNNPASGSRNFFLPPTTGGGLLNVSADLVDLGTLSLQGIGRAVLAADGGDIRGNGTVNIAGDLILRAAQVYPTSLATLDIFAYDPPGGTGSVTITGSGRGAVPLSAGGSLRIFASVINQSGTLRAPFGSIVLGWDGSDLDPTTPALDGPVDVVGGYRFNDQTGAFAPVVAPDARLVSLQAGSLTSVSAEGATIPLGLSSDGLTWIDPRGVDITLGGLPARGVTVAGEVVQSAAGSVVDLRGGGDLLAYQWIRGTGGSADILGTPSGAWGAGGEYEAGDLVEFAGRTYGARVSIDPQDFLRSPSPEDGRYWTLLPDYYALVPGLDSGFSPYAPYSRSGSAAALLGGDPGLVSNSLKLGEQIMLKGGGGLPPGTYTLLPARYALLPGAFLVSSEDGTLDAGGISKNSVEPALLTGLSRSVARADGSALVSGATRNSLSSPRLQGPLRSVFEVLTPAAVADRAEYAVYTANEFLAEAALAKGVSTVQRLPRDAAPLVVSGTSGLQLAGNVQAAGAGSGRAADIDLSSSSPIYLVGGAGAAPAGATAILDTGVLTSWQAGSLLVGGVRRVSSGTVEIDVRTPSLVLDNPGGSLEAVDVSLFSRESLLVTPGSRLAAGGSGTREPFVVTGDGVAIRTGADRNAGVSRFSVTGSTVPMLTIGAGASISGPGVSIDSTYGSDVSPWASVSAQTLSLAGGQISLVLSPQSGLAGSVIPRHLVLQGLLAAGAQASEVLNLTSYRSFDVYGDGSFGGGGQSLRISAAGIRGFSQAGPGAVISGGDVALGNPLGVSLSGSAPASIGALAITANNLTLGANTFQVSGFQQVALVAGNALIAGASGALDVAGNFAAFTPLITAADQASYRMVATGDVSLSGTGSSSAVPGLGATLSISGRSVYSGTSVLLPGGAAALRATGAGGVRLAGAVVVDGTRSSFYDLVRFAPAGRIDLVADQGDITLEAGSRLSASGASGGGDAGTIAISAPRGSFVSSATLAGLAGGLGAKAGSFILDADQLASYGIVRDALTLGGFSESQSFRVRTSPVVIDGTTTVRDFSLSADRGDIAVTGLIDASGRTGGSISLSTGGNLTLASSAALSVAAQEFSSSGQGGKISLEAGSAVGGAANPAAWLAMDSGSRIDLSVDDLVVGDYATPGSSAFRGQFEGTLHLRAPQTAGDVRLSAVGSTITGGSSILVEAFRVYDLPSGIMNTALRNQINADGVAFLGAAGAPSAAEAAIRSRLIGVHPQQATLDPLLVLAPGAEVVNSSGDLVLGLANPTGSTTTAARNEAFTAADWDLSGFRYGLRSAPGVLTLRAKGDVVFNNALSDGFTPVAASADSGWSRLWLAPLMTLNSQLPINTQSWSFRLTAGADTSSADAARVLPVTELAPGKGSILVGEFYPAILNNFTTGTAAGVGPNGQTADQIRFVNTSSDSTQRGTRFEVIRTGAGSIDVNAGLDIQLRNQFATIYSAGVALPDATKVFEANDFVVPIIPEADQHPRQGLLGAIQQRYEPQWSIGGGDVALQAAGSIMRTTMLGGAVVSDTSRQLPGNWLYRRGFVDPATGLFSSNGGVEDDNAINDPATSTAWWIDFSNFFQGIGALGGGDVEMLAGADIVNMDAVAPTTARMAGRDPASGLTLAPSLDKLLETGGGDLVVHAGGDISGGIYQVERGRGELFAGGSITSNEARSPSLYILAPSVQDPRLVQSVYPAVNDSLSWLPTTLFAGNSSFEVTARGDILLGPVVSTTLMPQGLNNKFWYKTYFNNYGESSSVDVLSLGGSVTHRISASGPGGGTESVLGLWLRNQNLFVGVGSANNASHYQPWLRLAETDVNQFATAATVAPPVLRSTALAGDINIVGDLNLFPSPSGTLELAATGSILGLQPTGRSLTPIEPREIFPAVPVPATIWTSATINLSDAPPASIPGVASPSAQQGFVGRIPIALRGSSDAPLAGLVAAFSETGSFSGESGAVAVQSALHDPGILHAAEPEPMRMYGLGGDISGLTLFSAKSARILAGTDITDVAFYVQNTSAADVSIVSAGRDIIPNNSGSARRLAANNLALGNYVAADDSIFLVDGTSVNALVGDIQISGPGLLEVLAGRTIDLGVGANVSDGTGVGITSIGNLRNPFLGDQGAGLVLVASTTAPGGGAALGLSGSSLNLGGFVAPSLSGVAPTESDYVAALDAFFRRLAEVGKSYGETGSYDAGYAAIAEVFGTAGLEAGLFTRSRDVRTVRGGDIRIAVPQGGVTMASSITGNPLAPPGIVTEYGGDLAILTGTGVDIGRARIFTLRGGDITIWASTGDIAAGSAPKTVVTAPPTRVSIDTTSAEVVTDLGGLATGGGIGTLQLRETDEPSDVVLVAPRGTVDAGDAGIQASGDITVAAAAVLNADNISAAGTSAGVPSAPAVAAPSVSSLSAPASSTAAVTAAASDLAKQSQSPAAAAEEPPSVITVEVLGYGGGEQPGTEREDEPASARREVDPPAAQTQAGGGVRQPPA